MPDKVKPSEFAAKVKEKYPVYKDVDDSILVAKIVEKYPQYKESIDFTVAEKPPVKIPSFRDFAASYGIGIERQRQAAEGTHGPDLAMKVQMDRDVEEAPERKRTRALREASRKEEALINTTKKKLDGRGVKYTDFDPIFKTELEKTRQDAESGNIVLSEDASRNPVYKQSLGFFESLGFALKNSVDESITSAKFDVADLRGKQKIAEEEMAKEQEAVPTGFMGKLGEILGGAAVPIWQARTGAAIGTQIAPGVGTAAGFIGSLAMTLPDAFSKGRKAETIRRYNEEISSIKQKKGIVSQEDKDAAMQKALSVGFVGGTAEAAVFAGLSAIAPGSKAAGKGLLNAFKNEAKHASYDVVRQTALGTGAEVAKGVAAKVAGYNVNAGDIIEDAVRRGGTDAEMALAFYGYHHAVNVPKYVQSAAKNYLSTVPRTDLNNMSQVLESNGVIPKGSTEKMNNDLDAFDQAKKEFQGLVPEEDMGVFAGLALKKKNLEEKIKSTTLAPVRAKLQEEADALDARIDTMLKSKNPVVDEVNDITGDTGEAEVLTEERLSEAISNIDKTPAEPATKTKEELTPTIVVEGREYTGADHGEAMQKAIEAGEDVPNPTTPEGEVWREQNGLFKEAETGNLLTREESNLKYGIDRSSKLAPTKEVVTETVSIPTKPLEGIEAEVKESKGLKMSTIRKYDTAEQQRIIDEVGEPSSARQAAMKALIDGYRFGEESFYKETGLSSTEKSWFVTKKGPNIEASAEMIWESLPEYVREKIEPQDIRNELIDLLGTYKSKDEVRGSYVESYAPKEPTETDYENWYKKNQTELAPLESEWRDWMIQEGEKEISTPLEESVIEDLIIKYEQESKGEGAEPPTRAAEEAPERAVSDVVIEKEPIIEKAERGERESFDEFTKRELARPEFDAEYQADRIPGEPREKYLLRKYCQ